MGTRDDARRFCYHGPHHHAWLKGPLLITAAPIKFTQSPTYVAYPASLPPGPHPKGPTCLSLVEGP